MVLLVEGVPDLLETVVDLFSCDEHGDLTCQGKVRGALGRNEVLEVALGMTAGFSALGAFANTAGFSDPPATSASILVLTSASVLACE